MPPILHFWGRFANRGGWQTAPKNVQAPWPLIIGLKSNTLHYVKQVHFVLSTTFTFYRPHRINNN